MGASKHMTAVTIQHIAWFACKDCSPGLGVEVMIYDRDLDDVVLGSLSLDGDGLVKLIDTHTGQPLPKPLMWAEKPYPVKGEK